jgi:SAM-dependent methyltransferase
MKKNPNVVLDVGCGKGYVVSELSRRGNKLRKSYLIGVDIFAPYLREAKHIYHDVICGDVRFLPIRSHSADVVLALDIIEHLESMDGFRLIKDLEQIAVNQIFIYTPVGFNPKSYLEDNNPWQAHRSVWHPNDFRSKGYKVLGIGGVRFLYGERHEFKLKHKIFFIPLLGIALFTQFFVFKFAHIAYQMLCIKEKHV